MNQPLLDALTALKTAGAMVLPKASTVDEAANGKVWSGKKANGELWKLIKNSEISFNVMC